MATSIASIAGDFKNVYDDYVEKQQNLKARFMDEIAKSLTKYSPGGNGFYGAINDYGNESVGAINETESFRTIDNEDYVQWVVKPKINVAPVQFSGLVAATAETDEEAFVGAVVDALDRARDRMLADENRQAFGMGTGVVGQLATNASSTATTLTLTSTQYVRANMVVDLVNSDGTITSGNSGLRISAVNRYTNQVTIAALGANFATTGTITKQNISVSAPSDGKEMMGLRGIVDDGTDLATSQGVTVSSTPIWAATRIAMSSSALTSDAIQRLLDSIEILSGEKPDKLVTHHNQRRSYLNIVLPQKRFADGKMDAGFEKLEFNGTELWLDKDCQVDTLYALSMDKIRKFELLPLEMGKHEGSDTFLRLVNSDQFQAYWRHYCNFGTSQRNAHGKLTGLAVNSGVA